MKKFIAKIILLVLLVIASLSVLLAFGVYVVGSQYQGGYNASLIDKVSRLKSINQPKIILVGNSNLSFGMNSPMIQEALNMPVVNLGLNRMLSKMFHEDISRLNINSGDIVIVCHSNYLDKNTIKDAGLAWVTVEYHKDLWEIIRPSDYARMICAFPLYWAKSFMLWITGRGNKSPEGAYSRAAFNECGDVVRKPESGKATREKLLKNKVNVPKINDNCIDRLNELNRYVRSRGAVMLIGGWPICYSEQTPTKEEYEAFEKELRSRLDCEVISDFRDYFIPYEYFYDYVLHLDAEGAKIRTRQLIEDLKNWKLRTHI